MLPISSTEQRFIPRDIRLKKRASEHNFQEQLVNVVVFLFEFEIQLFGSTLFGKKVSEFGF